MIDANAQVAYCDPAIDDLAYQYLGIDQIDDWRPSSFVILAGDSRLSIRSLKHANAAVTLDTGGGRIMQGLPDDVEML